MTHAGSGLRIPGPGWRSLPLLLISLWFTELGQSGSLSQEERFYSALLANSLSPSRHVLPAELKLARRLGITYPAVANKFLIGFDFDTATKAKLRSGEIRGSRSVERLPDGFSRLTVKLDGSHQQRVFYFKNGAFVTPVWYFARNWKRVESKHFSFRLSDGHQLHPEAITALEKFFTDASKLLELSAAEERLAEKEKIIYVLCSDEDEIERLTTFRTRGITLLSYDYIVTTYSCHFHEVLHLLINFKLKSAPLFTHPLLQEGFAAGFGGRGGIALNSVLQSGVFLHDTKFLQYKELLSARQMLDNDASLTYPVSGLYVRFLMKTIGLKGFLSLYSKFSTTLNGVNTLVLDEKDLPPDDLWNRFVDSVRNQPDMTFTPPAGNVNPLVSDSVASLASQGKFYRVRMRGSFALRPENIVSGYASRVFKEALPLSEYRGERYLFIADTNEVTVYDVYLNTSIAAFSSGFTVPPQKPKWENGWCEFWIRKNVFSVPPDNMMVLSVAK